MKTVIFDAALCFSQNHRHSHTTTVISPYNLGQIMRKFVLYANNKGADQPAHPRSLISTFVIRCLDSMICILAISKVSRF